jgi:hypothetical protein
LCISAILQGCCEKGAASEKHFAPLGTFVPPLEARQRIKRLAAGARRATDNASMSCGKIPIGAA